MPVQYAGILEEHRAVRERVGTLRRLAHGRARVHAERARSPRCSALTCNDVARLADGRIHYSALLTERGTFVDDMLVYRRAADSYLMVVNASNTPKDFAWASCARPRGDVRGRGSERRLRADRGAGTRRGRAHAAGLHAGSRRICRTTGSARTPRSAATGALVSRTGYTGEDGFEIYCRPEDAEGIFRALLAEGRVGRRRSRAAWAPATRCGWRRRWRSTATTSTTRSRPGRRTSPGSSRWARATSSGATRSPRRSRRACRGSSSASRWSTAASRATAIPRRRPRAPAS